MIVQFSQFVIFNLRARGEMDTHQNSTRIIVGSNPTERTNK